MKLNHECVRDLLLYIEENLSFGEELQVNCLKLKNYSIEELLYTSQKLEEAEYIKCSNSFYADDDYPVILVTSISYKGHQFLDTVRDNQVWSKTKGILGFLKSASIEITSETAAKVINHLIDQNFSV